MITSSEGKAVWSSVTTDQAYCHSGKDGPTHPAVGIISQHNFQILNSAFGKHVHVL